MKDYPKPRAQGATQGNARESSESRGGCRRGRGWANHGRSRGGRGGRDSSQAAADGGYSGTVSPTASTGGGSGSSGVSFSGRAVNLGGDNTPMGNAGVDSSQPIGQAGSVSGASPAAARAATAPSAYSAAQSVWTADSLSSMPSTGAQPWRFVTLGTN